MRQEREERYYDLHKNKYEEEIRRKGKGI